MYFLISFYEVIGLRRLLKSWLFFTSLMLLLLAAALALPELGQGFLGETEERLTEAMAYISQEVQTVWAGQ